ncbi:MAG: hypothetical protein MUF81_19190 [Verrucomicrobia bacterium]|jgi:hypothetical protein|nr:hypothetical protein [Verrucomicrobiota bacterium]
MKKMIVVFGMAAALFTVGGCATLDKAYNAEVTWTNAPVVKVVTNTVVVTNVVPQIVERQSVVLVTNQTTGAVSGYVAREPVATNFVTLLVTNTIPMFETNVVQVPVTNLVAKPAALATIDATGGLVNTFLPGIGSMLALLLGGLYHGYRQLRNRRVNEALVQGVETAREILTTTPQGEAADAAFVKWLMEHQKEAGVFVSVSKLVDAFTDNPAAKMTAQEIAERVKKAGAVRTTA